MIELAAVALVIAYLAWENHQTAKILCAGRDTQRDLVALTDRLAQRIQAPEIAVAEHSAHVMGEYAPPAVGMDDDLAHWDSKEQLADRLEAMTNGDR